MLATVEQAAYVVSSESCIIIVIVMFRATPSRQPPLSRHLKLMYLYSLLHPFTDLFTLESILPAPRFLEQWPHTLYFLTFQPRLSEVRNSMFRCYSLSARAVPKARTRMRLTFLGSLHSTPLDPVNMTPFRQSLRVDLEYPHSTRIFKE